MKLYYIPAACSLLVHIVLRELGLPFMLEAVDPKVRKTASGSDFMSINPTGYVPVLELDDGEVLTETAAIAQHLVDRHAPGILAPIAGTIERARVNAHLNFIAAELHKGFTPLFDPESTNETRAVVMSELRRKFDVIRGVLSDGRPYLTGSAYTIADAYLFVVLAWPRILDVDLARGSEFDGLRRRVNTRSAVQTALKAEGLRSFN